MLAARQLDVEAARTGHTMVALASELALVVGPEHGGWVHWGATRSSIMLLTRWDPGAAASRTP